jgi:hypothetical protein
MNKSSKVNETMKGNSKNSKNPRVCCCCW